jgi:phosphohistidine swiveling domain-containing protein
MGLPCIVGIPNLMQRLQDGDEIIMDGSTGFIKILNR